MPRKPKLVDGVFLLHDGRGAWLRSSGETILVPPVFADGIAADLLPLLDGKRTVSQICQKMRNRNPIIIRHFLFLLNKAVLLDEGGESTASGGGSEPRSRDFLTLKGNLRTRCRNRLKESAVLVLDTGVLGEAGLNVFKTSGFRTLTRFPLKLKGGKVDPFWQSLFSNEEGKLTRLAHQHDLLILATHVRFSSLALLLNRVSLKTRKPLLLANLGSLRGVLLAVWPHRTACFACIHSWRLNNDRSYEREIALDEAVPPAIWKGLEPFMAIKAMLGSLLLLETVRIFCTPLSAVSLAAELEIDFLTLTSRLHPVAKLPRCGLCSLYARTSPYQAPVNFENKWVFKSEIQEFVPQVGGTRENVRIKKPSGFR